MLLLNSKGEIFEGGTEFLQPLVYGHWTQGSRSFVEQRVILAKEKKCFERALAWHTYGLIDLIPGWHHMRVMEALPDFQYLAASPVLSFSYP